MRGARDAAEREAWLRRRKLLRIPRRSFPAVTDAAARLPAKGPALGVANLRAIALERLRELAF